MDSVIKADRRAEDQKWLQIKPSFAPSCHPFIRMNVSEIKKYRFQPFKMVSSFFQVSRFSLVMSILFWLKSQEPGVCNCGSSGTNGSRLQLYRRHRRTAHLKICHFNLMTSKDKYGPSELCITPREAERRRQSQRLMWRALLHWVWTPPRSSISELIKFSSANLAEICSFSADWKCFSCR